MVDRTANTTFVETNPNYVVGTTSASNGDSFIVPSGTIRRCVIQTSADNDAIVTATTSGSTVTISAVDDGQTTITVDFNMFFMVILDHQTRA